ncbi:hypothetical protein VaNZ11_003537 [Volvox africanus]|uniref:Uncharacterized protein n=1 Tax=Volvox africanus TaxID=51714 RepID=A0ABQ5RW34_9CHLO|nr:hypothetical protein VaNZ11_003535 [Volvox africanus]GLI61237.1 hypothetical protein VaNZ11_003537 [Volvox africanus]
MQRRRVAGTHELPPLAPPPATTPSTLPPPSPLQQLGAAAAILTAGMAAPEDEAPPHDPGPTQSGQVFSLGVVDPSTAALHSRRRGQLLNRGCGRGRKRGRSHGDRDDLATNAPCFPPQQSQGPRGEDMEDHPAGAEDPVAANIPSLTPAVRGRRASITHGCTYVSPDTNEPRSSAYIGLFCATPTMSPSLEFTL